MPLQTITKGALPMASDINQMIRMAQGDVDIGEVNYPGETYAPSTAPSVTLSAGSLSGSYQWGFYWITGSVNDSGTVSVTGRTTPSPYSAVQALSSQQGTVSISGQTIPSQVIGWGVVRNKAGGSTWYEVPGSEQFGNSDGTNIPQVYIDNTADANLVTAAPASNTTGTSLTGNFNVGVNNASVNQQKSVTLNTDTRTTNMTFNASNQLSTITEIDPNNSNATVSTTTLTYNASNQLSTITQTATGHTVTTTLNYTNGQISSVTKAVN